MAQKLKDAVDARAAEIAQMDAMAQDLQTLLDAIPYGQLKQLIKDDTCASILSKYGIQS